MVTITKQIGIDAGHRVPGHQGKCSSPHGHRYTFTARVEGIPQADGMIVDFGIIKTLMLEHIDEPWDHAMIVWEDDSALLEAMAGHDWKVAVIDAPPTAEELARIAAERIAPHLGFGLKLIGMACKETPTCEAEHICG